MNAVMRATSKQNAAFPAPRYAVPGKVVPGAQWDEESRADLFNDLLTHLVTRPGDPDSEIGNQILFILEEAGGSSSFVQVVSRLVHHHLRRVLRARLRQSSYGHISELLISKIKGPPFVTIHFRMKLRDCVFGTDQVRHERHFESEGEEFQRAVARFQQMRRNKVSLKMLNPGGDETFPRWFNGEELALAALDIINTIVGSAVPLDFLLRSLEIAMRDLDMFEEAFVETDYGLSGGEEIPSGEPDFSSDHVQTANLPDLLQEDDVGFLLDVLDEEVKAVLAVFEDAFDQLDKAILASNHNAEDLTDEALAKRLDVSAKTISRRRKEKILPVLDRLRRKDPQGLLMALRVYLGAPRGEYA